MISRINAIAEKVKLKLNDKLYLDNLLKDSPYRPSIDDLLIKINMYQTMQKLQESKTENYNGYIQFLLEIACEFDMLREVNELLELNLLKNIDEPLELDDKGVNHGKTLLGIAAYHGHFDLVAYFIEVRLANVNAKDKKGNTCLHQVVYGDSYPFNNSSYGASHDIVAKYIMRHGYDSSILNNNGQTADELTKACAPLSIEKMLGRRFVTNTGSAAYYADKVRPIFEKELKIRSGGPILRIGNPSDKQIVKFENFCLQHAIVEYVKNGIALFGFSSQQELFQILDVLPEEEWKSMRQYIRSQEPEHYSFKYGPISKQIPSILKQCVIIGIVAAIAVYHETKSIFMSTLVGSFSATLAWKLLSEKACSNDLSERSVKMSRVNELLQHIRFFKSNCNNFSREGVVQTSDVELGMRLPEAQRQGLSEIKKTLSLSSVRY